MSELKIRNLDDSVLLRLTELAREKNLSREEYVRRILKGLAASAEVREIEDRVNTNLELTAAALQALSNRIDMLIHVLSE